MAITPSWKPRIPNVYLPLCLMLAAVGLEGADSPPSPVQLDLQVAFEADLGQEIGQIRTQAITLPGDRKAFLVAYSADFDVDPWVEMFFYPTDTLKLAVVTTEGEVLWKHDLGRGIPPGHWFCPVRAFDLDGDGYEEIWCVTNPDEEHPLGIRKYRLSRLHAASGEETGNWKWPQPYHRQSLSHLFRNFILGAHVEGQPVLITAQGTYGPMKVQAWNPDMTKRWELDIGADDPGARGSHMVPVVDWDGDGSDELLWGERLIDVRTGEEIWCADENVYAGHSDIIFPFYDWNAESWWLYTCRESDRQASPRVIVFDEKGKRVWGAVEEGHMDIGWLAHLQDRDSLVALAIRIGRKTLGPGGRFHHGIDEFLFDARTGKPVELGFELYGLSPVDLTGDGIQELVARRKERDGLILDGWGRTIGHIEGGLSFHGKFMDLPGEQMLTYTEDGLLRFLYNANAEDAEVARKRYAHPFYQANLNNCNRVLSGF